MFHARTSSLQHQSSNQSSSSSVYSLRSSLLCNKNQYDIPPYGNKSDSKQSIDGVLSYHIKQHLDVTYRKVPHNPYAESFWQQCYGDEKEIDIRNQEASKPTQTEIFEKYKEMELPKINFDFRNRTLESGHKLTDKYYSQKKRLVPNNSLLNEFPTPITPHKTQYVPLEFQAILESEELYLSLIKKTEMAHNSFYDFTSNHNILIRKKDVLLMFGNFRTIQELSERLLHNLKADLNVSDNKSLPGKLTKTFCEHVKRISINYESYISFNIERLQFWQSKINAADTLKVWVKEIETTLNITVQTLIHAPIKRISAYYRLIDCYLRKEESQRDNKPLQECSSTLREILKVYDKQISKYNTDSVVENKLSSPFMLEIPIKECHNHSYYEKKPIGPTEILWSVVQRFKSNHDLFLYVTKCIIQVCHLFQIESHASVKISKLFWDYSEKFDHNIADRFIIKKLINSKEAVSSSLVTPITRFHSDRYITSTYELFKDKTAQCSDLTNQLIDDFETSVSNLIDQVNFLFDSWNSKATMRLKEFQQIHETLKKAEDNTNKKHSLICNNNHVLPEDQVDFVFQLQKISFHYHSLIDLLIKKLFKFECDLFTIRSSGRFKETISCQEIIDNFKYLKQLNKEMILNYAKDINLLDLSHLHESIGLCKVLKNLYTG